MPLDPAERSLRARIGVNDSWARTEDWSARTAPARKAALDRFEHQVDPQNRLSPEARARRARKAQQAHMQAIALKAVEKRRKKREARASTTSATGAEEPAA